VTQKRATQGTNAAITSRRDARPHACARRGGGTGKDRLIGAPARLRWKCAAATHYYSHRGGRMSYTKNNVTVEQGQNHSVIHNGLEPKQIKAAASVVNKAIKYLDLAHARSMGALRSMLGATTPCRG